MEVWQETSELYNGDHFYTRQTRTKSAACQVLCGLKTGWSAASNTLMAWRLQAVVPRPKDKADNGSTCSSMSQLLYCQCLEPFSAYLSHRLCMCWGEISATAAPSVPKGTGLGKGSWHSKKHRHRQFDSTSAQSVLWHLNHLEVCAYVMDSIHLDIFWFDWFLLNICWCSLDPTERTEHCSPLLVWWLQIKVMAGKREGRQRLVRLSQPFCPALFFPDKSPAATSTWLTNLHNVALLRHTSSSCGGCDPEPCDCRKRCHWRRCLSPSVGHSAWKPTGFPSKGQQNCHQCLELSRSTWSV